MNQDADSSEYIVSSTTGMEDGQRVSVYNNQCDTPSIASRSNRQLDASCFDLAYSGLSGSHYSLFEQANYIHTTIHDALVEEVLRMSRDGLNTHPLVKRMALDGLGHISLADTNTSHNRSIDDISAIASPDIPMSSNMRTTSIPGYLCDAGSECSQVSSVTSKVSQTVPQPVISCTQPPAGAFASQCMGVHPPPTFVVPYPYTSRPSINSDITHY
ncbi:hypothetical protein FBUS_02201 [Fasciolopsis buskii]|uniref:Uncharacterized protein n=1 Tax=Fasciolopsis buskii TaxID=27845 RepID=A0A8E0RP52_9TREM|nr:hypothetical protein FBUS_02201 [Fasciolopsis buski]